MKIIVTGGAGFIGANLCRDLVRADGITEVVAYDDLSTGQRCNLEGAPDARLVAASILDASAMDEAIQGMDAVVHLAARASVPRSLADPIATHEVNATGTVRVLEAARRAGVAHVVVASSSSVYGSNPTSPKHERLAPLPVSPYAASKLAAEAYALAWGSSYDIPMLAFRFFNVFGPLQAAGHAYAAAVPSFISAALAGEPVTIHGDGEQTRDFTYVQSVTRVLVEAVRRRVTSAEPVNLAFGERRSILELLADLECVMARPIRRRHAPPRPGDVRDSQADPTALLRLFPTSEQVPMREALATTVSWFRRVGVR
ncbi:MAG: NAD-dependent epimerase/dehydratase family protein [Acidimicrobiales bacterium]